MRYRGRIGARALAVSVACAVPLAGCSLFSAPSATETSAYTPSVTPSSSPSATTSPSPTASPSPSPSPSATQATPPTGPITGVPAGTPVKPEIFLATVDTAGGVLKVVTDVPDIFEDGGLCTVAVTAGSTKLQEHNTGAANATNTACGQFVFDLGALPSGKATIVASYQSAKHSGSSDPYPVTLP